MCERNVGNSTCVYCQSERNIPYVRAYFSRHPGVSRAHQANRRARVRGAGGRFTAADIAAILIAQKGRCALCRKKFGKTRFHRDHIISLADGGSNGRRNIQLLCEPCNLAKGARDPISHNQRRTRGDRQPLLL